MLQGVLSFREGIDLPSHPSGVLAYRQVVALHAIRIDCVADRRRSQGRCDRRSGPGEDAPGDVDHPPMRTLFNDHRVAQVWWRVAAGFGHTPTCPLPWWCVVHTIESLAGGLSASADRGKQGLPHRGNSLLASDANSLCCATAKTPCIGYKSTRTLFSIRPLERFQLQSLSLAKHKRCGSFKYRFAWLCRGVLHVKVITQSRETTELRDALRPIRRCRVSHSSRPGRGLCTST